MITPLTVRQTTFGEGLPKVCIPIVGSTQADILKAATDLQKLSFDMAEWRADFYEDITVLPKVMETLSLLRQALPDKLLLFTFRTSKEGGKRPISPESYHALNCSAASSGLVDFIDVEMYMGEKLAVDITASAHASDIHVIMSNHDFHKTPKKEEIIARLRHMQNLDADIPKIAVMPQNKADVITLLAATSEMAESYADRPIITMAMGHTGVISRLCGEFFGSCLTFASAGQASAPGQINSVLLNELLNMLHPIF